MLGSVPLNYVLHFFVNYHHRLRERDKRYGSFQLHKESKPNQFSHSIFQRGGILVCVLSMLPTSRSANFSQSDPLLSVVKPLSFQLRNLACLFEELGVDIPPYVTMP